MCEDPSGCSTVCSGGPGGRAPETLHGAHAGRDHAGQECRVDGELAAAAACPQHEERRCKDDGKVYTFGQFVERFSAEYGLDDLRNYWRDFCRPLHLERDALLLDKVQAAAREQRLRALRAPAEHVFHLVSLGGWCGPKLAFRQLQRLDGPSLPWDWGRSTLDHVISMLRSDFTGFLDADGRLESRWAAQGMCHPHGVICTTPGHAFWHHDLFDPKDRQILERRITRFRDLGEFRPLVFVRAVITTMELRRAESLLSLLKERFGYAPYLLLLIDWQVATRTMVVGDCPGLLVHTVQEGSTPKGQHNSFPYCRPIVEVVEHAHTGEVPQGWLRVGSMVDMLDPASGLVRHVSLGECLTDPMSYEPLMPPSSSMARASVGDLLDREILREQMQHAWTFQTTGNET